MGWNPYWSLAVSPWASCWPIRKMAAVKVPLPRWAAVRTEPDDVQKALGLMGGCCCSRMLALCFTRRALSLRQCPAILGLSEALWEPAGLLEPVLGMRQGLPRGEGSPKPPPPGSEFYTAMDLDAELGSRGWSGTLLPGPSSFLSARPQGP